MLEKNVPVVSLPSVTPKSRVALSDCIPVSRSLADELGDTAAKLLQQIHYWLTTKSGEVVDGAHYIYNTMEQWAEQLGCSPATVKRAIKELREAGLIETIRRWTHEGKCPNWYTLNYQRLETFLIDLGKRPKRLGQNDPNDWVKMTQINTEEQPQKIKPQQTAGSVSEPTLNSESDRTLEHETHVPLKSDPTNPEQDPDLVTQAQAIAREVVPLNPTIAGVVRQTVAQLGAAALDRISAAAEVVKSNKARNPAGLFVQALKMGWRPRPSEPAATHTALPSSVPVATLSELSQEECDRQRAEIERVKATLLPQAPAPAPARPVKNDIPDGWHEWSAQAVRAGLEVKVQPDEFGELEVCLNGEWFSPKQAMKMHPLDELRLLARGAR